jgi:PAS domain S-box-containing protein
MSDAIVYADAEGVIRLWNRGATRIFGFTEAEALGRSPDIVIPERLRERHWQGYRTTMRTGQTRYRDGQVLSIPAVRKDGAQISVEFTMPPRDLRNYEPCASPPTATLPGRDRTAA